MPTRHKFHADFIFALHGLVAATVAVVLLHSYDACDFAQLLSPPHFTIIINPHSAQMLLNSSLSIIYYLECVYALHRAVTATNPLTNLI